MAPEGKQVVEGEIKGHPRCKMRKIGKMKIDNWYFRNERIGVLSNQNHEDGK